MKVRRRHKVKGRKQYGNQNRGKYQTAQDTKGNHAGAAFGGSACFRGGGKQMGTRRDDAGHHPAAEACLLFSDNNQLKKLSFTPKSSI